jgi:hypothetical protein
MVELYIDLQLLLSIDLCHFIDILLWKVHIARLEMLLYVILFIFNII